LLAQRDKLCFLFGQQAKKVTPPSFVLFCGQQLSIVLDIEPGNELVHDACALFYGSSVALDSDVFKLQFCDGTPAPRAQAVRQ
jgi:hypothetical protein